MIFAYISATLLSVHIIFGAMLAATYYSGCREEFPKVRWQDEFKYSFGTIVNICFFWPFIDSELLAKLLDRVLK